MPETLNHFHKIRKKILRETGVLVGIWALIGGIGGFLFFEETLKVVKSWILPLLELPLQNGNPQILPALQNVSDLLTTMEAYGSYVIVCALGLSSVLFWLSLREILKTNCSDRHSSGNGER